MNFILRPWQLFLMILAGWVHREQQKVIDFYQAQLKAAMDAEGSGCAQSFRLPMAAVDFERDALTAAVSFPR